jgi:hypothetical protein
MPRVRAGPVIFVSRGNSMTEYKLVLWIIFITYAGGILLLFGVIGRAVLL